MLEKGHLLPSQESGLTTTLMNKFFKIKYEEEFVQNQQILPEGSNEKYSFAGLFDSVLRKRTDPEISVDDGEFLVSGRLTTDARETEERFCQVHEGQESLHSGLRRERRGRADHLRPQKQENRQEKSAIFGKSDFQNHEANVQVLQEIIRI